MMLHAGNTALEADYAGVLFNFTLWRIWGKFFNPIELPPRMRHDQRKVRNLLEGARAYTLRDLTLLKIILTSGLYPQLAVADEFNGGKASGADQLFHTKVKPFNVLHPNCVFAASPGIQELWEFGLFIFLTSMAMALDLELHVKSAANSSLS